MLIFLGNINHTNTYKETSLQFVLTAIREPLRPGGRLSMNKFIRQNFAGATSFKTLISRLP